MTKSKYIIEKNLTSGDIEKLGWLYKGFVTINETGRRLALEKMVGSKSESVKYKSPLEFDSKALTSEVPLKKIPIKYRNEIKRYSDMLLSNISELLEENTISKSEIGKALGIPEENYLLELKSEKNTYYVLIDKKRKKMDLIRDEDKVPKNFRKNLR